MRRKIHGCHTVVKLRVKDSNALDHLLAVLRSPERAAEFAGQPAVWEEIKRLAEVHRFTGHLAWVTSAWLPPSEKTWRDQTLMTHHRKHAQRLKALRRLVEAFAEERIACVSLKGPLLAERSYEHPFLRPARDLDMLVCESDIGRAAGLMMKLGFDLPGSSPWPLHREIDKHLDFSPTAHLPRVEMHYRLKGGGTFLPPGEFIERACKWSSPAGFEAMVLSPADELFYCGVHAANHAFHRIRWLYDTIRIAGRLTDAELQYVRELARRHSQTGRFIALAIAAQNCFAEPLALNVSDFEVPWLWSKLSARHVRKMVTRVEGNTATLAEKFGYRLDLCRMAGTPFDAAKLLATGLNVEVQKRWYYLRNSAKPGLLARTLPE
ncbi:MAG TPA: nucleotidyltransferase family protein [Bryobacteraceae bacterium]